MTIAPDAIFPHTAELEIPILLENRQANFVDLPVRGWGSVARRSRFRGTWHFYVDDTKFNALWKRPEDILKTRCVNCCEANFSTDVQMPWPVALYRIYQKRWMARYWQENGIDVFVDLSVAAPYEHLNLEGVPSGWQSYCTAANDSCLDILESHAERALNHACGKDNGPQKPRQRALPRIGRTDIQYRN